VPAKPLLLNLFQPSVRSPRKDGATFVEAQCQVTCQDRVTLMGGRGWLWSAVLFLCDLELRVCSVIRVPGPRLLRCHEVLGLSSWSSLLLGYVCRGCNGRPATLPRCKVGSCDSCFRCLQLPSSIMDMPDLALRAGTARMIVTLGGSFGCF